MLRSHFFLALGAIAAIVFLGVMMPTDWLMMLIAAGCLLALFGANFALSFLQSYQMQSALAVSALVFAAWTVTSAALWSLRAPLPPAFSLLTTVVYGCMLARLPFRFVVPLLAVALVGFVVALLLVHVAWYDIVMVMAHVLAMVLAGVVSSSTTERTLRYNYLNKVRATWLVRSAAWQAH